MFNDRGSVLCAADVSPLVAQGMVKTYESCAVYDPFDDPRFGSVDRGGNLNLLTPPDSLMTDAEVTARVMAVWQDKDNRPPAEPLGPATRAEFVSLLPAA